MLPFTGLAILTGYRGRGPWLVRRLVASPIEYVEVGIARHEAMLDNRRRNQRLPFVCKAAHSHNAPLAVNGLLRRSERDLHLDRLADSWGVVRAKQHARMADVLGSPRVPMGRAGQSKLQRQVQRKARRSNDWLGHEMGRRAQHCGRVARLGTIQELRFGVKCAGSLSRYGTKVSGLRERCARSRARGAQ